MLHYDHTLFLKIQDKLSNEERRPAHKIIKLVLEEIEKEKQAVILDTINN